MRKIRVVNWNAEEKEKGARKSHLHIDKSQERNISAVGIEVKAIEKVANAIEMPLPEVGL